MSVRAAAARLLRGWRRLPRDTSSTASATATTPTNTATTTTITTGSLRPFSAATTGVRLCAQERGGGGTPPNPLPNANWLDDVRAAPQGGASLPAGAAHALDARRRRCVYRSKQRGWLELDVILGNWAVRHVPRLDETQLRVYEAMLECETPLLYKYVSGQEAAPEALRDTEVFRSIRAFVASAGVRRSAEAAAARVREL